MHWLSRALRRRTERGAATVEFALVSLPMFILILGLIQYGWYFYVAQNTSSAASQRRAAARGRGLLDRQ